MRKGVLAVMLIVLLAQAVVAKERNITERVVLLNGGALKVRFINMGVDANWGSEVLDNAAKALPVLEDMIGVDFPTEVEGVDIYGSPQENDLYVGGNDGSRIVILATHPADPTYIYHELVHYWTLHYDVPWALSEGYAVLYSYLLAIHFDEDVVAYRQFKTMSLSAFVHETKENITYIDTASPRNLVVLNSFDYRKESDETKIDYFYGMSSAIMFTLADVYDEHDFHVYGIGIERLKEVNKRMMSSEFDSSVSGIGTLQYIELLRGMTGESMSDLFLPVFFSTWDDSTRVAFADSFSYLASAKAITGQEHALDIDAGMKELAAGNIMGATNYFSLAVKAYYEALAATTPPPTIVPTPPPETGLRRVMRLVTESTWFLPLVLIAVIVLIFGGIGIYYYLRSRKEEQFTKYLEEIRNE